MSRAPRLVAITASVLAATAVGLIYPLASRGWGWRAVVWEHPLVGLAALLVPVVVYFTTVGADRRVPTLTLPTVAPLVLGPRGARARFRDLPGVLRGAALLLGILALMRPENVLRGENAQESGIDIVLVLDLSGSMRALMDQGEGASPPNTPDTPTDRAASKRLTRLETAKDVILEFVSRRKTDRIGVVVFGRSAFILSPPTLDKSLLSGLVSKMELELIDGNGTAIGDAVGTAVARLRRSTARSKAIILLTDGDSNAGTVAPEYAAHLAQTQGVKVYTVQIGDGDEVDVQDGVDLFGQPHFIRTHFPVNPELLRKIAHDTGGESYVATDKKSLSVSMHTILDTLEKTRFESQSATMEDLFPLLLLPAVMLLVLEALSRAWLVRRFP